MSYPHNETPLCWEKGCPDHQPDICPICGSDVGHKINCPRGCAFTTKPDYATRFLKLAAMPGMETLRQKCTCRCHMATTTILGWEWHHNHVAVCPSTCPGWLPLLEAEQLGALVRVAIGNDEHIVMYPLYSPTERMDMFVGVQVKFEGGIVGEGPTPEAALTEALLTALKEKR